MPQYQQPIDKSYLERKVYKQNTIKISNETNHLGQYNVEIATISNTNSIQIKQYQLYPNQLKLLLEKNNQSNNPSQIQYINTDSLYSDIGSNFNSTPDIISSNHPEYSNMNNPSHLSSYQQTIDIKNNNTIDKTNIMDMENIGGFDNFSNNFQQYTSFNNEKEDCSRQYG